MKVVFWSPVAGKCATSSSMAVLASHISLDGNGRYCILPLNCYNRGAQGAFIAKESDTSLKQSIGSFGVDALLMGAADRVHNAEELRDAALQIHGGLDLFTVTSDPRVQRTISSLTDRYDVIVDALNVCYDAVFIDIGSGYSSLAEKAMETADVIVVCLCQDKEVIDSYFEMCDLQHLPCIYLVGNYDGNILMSMKNIRRKYKQLTAGNSVKLVHCAEFANAINKSALLKWIVLNGGADSSGFSLSKKSSTAAFFDDLKRLESKIAKYSGGVAR